MKIPPKIKIGAHTYKIILEPDTLATSTGNCSGKINKETGILSINSSQIQSEQEATLIHEILHSINNEMNEEQIEFLAQALYQVLKDNKMLR